MMSATAIVMTVATSFIQRNDMEYIAYRNPLESRKTKCSVVAYFIELDRYVVCALDTVHTLSNSMGLFTLHGTGTGVKFSFAPPVFIHPPPT